MLKTLNLDVGEGEFLVLLGPSGCGKSTLLNCIAGLLDVSDGQIFIKGKNVTWEEPKDRGIGMVFQSYALYPQMTVEGNLSFGLKTARLPKDEIDKRVARAAEILQIEPLLQRKPSQLSGGQRQRVAIGRALVRDVDVFLFDEPLSNLDAKLRSELRVEIKRLHQRLANTMIYVTHDQIEAMTLADRIAVMKGGADPAARHAAGDLQPAGQPLRRRLHRLARHELPRRRDRGRRARRPSAPTMFAVPLARYGFDNGARAGRRRSCSASGRSTSSMAHAASGQPFSKEIEVEIVEPMGSDTLVWTKLGGQNLSFRVEAEKALNVGERILDRLRPGARLAVRRRQR